MKVVNNITFILMILQFSKTFSNNISIHHSKSNLHYNYSIEEKNFYDEMLSKSNKTELISKYNNDNLNSVHLSSNILFNKIYLDECLKCKKDDVKDYCCIGSYYNLTCLYMDECNNLMNKEDLKIITLVFSLYFSVLILFAFITGFIIWFLSVKIKNQKTSIMNGIYIFLCITFIGTFVPFIIVLLVKIFKKIDCVEFLKADFNNLTDNYILTADTIENSTIIRPKSNIRNNLSSNSENIFNSNYENNNNFSIERQDNKSNNIFGTSNAKRNDIKIQSHN